MSTIKVKPITSSWTTAAFPKRTSMPMTNTTSTNIDMEEIIYLSIMWLSLGALVLTFILKRKT